jgi:hypothetical protein
LVRIMIRLKLGRWIRENHWLDKKSFDDSGQERDFEKMMFVTNAANRRVFVVESDQSKAKQNKLHETKERKGNYTDDHLLAEIDVKHSLFHNPLQNYQPYSSD